MLRDKSLLVLLCFVMFLIFLSIFRGARVSPAYDLPAYDAPIEEGEVMGGMGDEEEEEEEFIGESFSVTKMSVKRVDLEVLERDIQHLAVEVTDLHMEEMPLMEFEQ